jgi:hypothetical protein
MKSKRLLQKVYLKGKKSKVRPILVENDHPLFESYEDLKTFFPGNIQLAIPRVSNDKSWSNADQIEYYSPVEGNVEKITSVEYDNKVKPLLDKLIESFKNLSFDESDPDQFEKKALLNSFKLPSEDLSEYVVKVGSHYVLCNWGLENAPKLGELPPPPVKPKRDEESVFESEVEGGSEDHKEEFNDTNDTEDYSSSYEDEIDQDDFVEVDEGDFDQETTESVIEEDEHEAVSWFRENWWKILLGILLLILLLFLIRECSDNPSGRSPVGPTTQPGTNQPGEPETETTSPGSNQQGETQPGIADQGTGDSGQSGSSGGGSSPDNIESGDESSMLTPSPPSAQSPPIIRERPDELLENEQEFSQGIPTDQWDKIGTIFQMETEEGVWYWLRLKNGDTYLMDFIPQDGQTNSVEADKNNYNTI